MNKFLVILVILLVSCTETNSKSKQKQTLNMDWIVGNWVRVTEENSESKTYENWTKISETEYKGHGFVVKDGVTVGEEHIKLYKTNSEWNFEVSGVNEEATNFKITEFTKNSFVSENQENDFPKIIEYTLEKDTLKAKIAGGGKEIQFIFVKN